MSILSVALGKREIVPPEPSMSPHVILGDI